MKAEPLHDFAAMAFHRLDAESEPIRDRAGAMSFGHQSEHFDLTLSKAV
jgi:hypothetical protein